jgi:hypothetical protein
MGLTERRDPQTEACPNRRSASIDANLWRDRRHHHVIGRRWSFGDGQDAVFFGCNWNLVGQGQVTYTLDLTKPDWCGPTACFDLQATNINFVTPWTPLPSTVELRIERLAFGVDPSQALPQGARIGTSACQ